MKPLHIISKTYRHFEKPSHRTVHAFVCILLVCAMHGKAATWSGLRDGIVYVRSSQKHTIRVSWKEVWAARGHPKTLYWQAPDGSLLERVSIGSEDTKGSRNLTTSAQKGDHRLYIPGRTFRQYEVIVPNGIKSVFEPVKHHFSMNIRSNSKFYFVVPKGSSFSLKGKFFAGASKLLFGKNGTTPLMLNLSKYDDRHFHRHDGKRVEQAEPGIWSVLPNGGIGKAAFWLDDIPNVFALDSNDLFVPVLLPGNARIRVSTEIAGRTPRLGASVPEHKLPPNVYRQFAPLNLASAALYSLQKRCWRGEGGVRPDCGYYEPYRRYAEIPTFVTMFISGHPPFDRGNTDKKSLSSYSSFILNFLSYQSKSCDWNTHYFAVFDEPNFRFATVDAFESFLKSMWPVTDSLRRSSTSLKCMVPGSSNFLAGPMSTDAHSRLGIDWAREILESHWDHIDAVSWHEWYVRHPIAAEWFDKSVRQAWDMVEQIRPKNSRSKDLCITQTNMGPGADVSPYQMESFQAATWLASAVINAAQSGRLSLLNWFPGIDDSYHRKGLATRTGYTLHLRPVAYAMGFLSDGLQDSVLHTENTSIECQGLASVNGRGDTVSILIVNKENRAQSITVSCDNLKTISNRPIEYSLETMTPDSRSHTSPGATQPKPFNGSVTIDMAQAAICRITLMPVTNTHER